MSAAFRLADRCPRLAKARDDYLAWVRQEAARRRFLAAQRLELNRLIAHRELQLVRAQHTNDARYIARRQHKLERAYQQLEHLEHKFGAEAA